MCREIHNGFAAVVKYLPLQDGRETNHGDSRRLVQGQCFCPNKYISHPFSFQDI